MDAFYRPTWAEISLDALRHNLQAMREAVPNNCRIMATVKANAYGHGAVEISREAERFGVDYLGVAFLDEALQLRRAGVTLPILVFGFVPVEALELAREYRITISLYREDIRRAAGKLAPHADGRKLKAHIKIDSGMGRLGIIGHDEAMAFIESALNTPQLEIEGLFTHYAKADEADKSYTELQYSRFQALADSVRRKGWNIPIMHAANSAAGIDTPEWAGDMVRFGIGMYGLYPSAEVNKQRIALKPVMSLKTRIVMIKTAPEGWGISYGARYVTKQEERLGTLPIGYADGYSRMLSGKASGLIRGVKLPIRGTICMDQCMIALDSPSIDNENQPVEPGEEVVLIGLQGEGRISAEDLAEQLGTINYEVTCMISARVPRVYLDGGKTIAIYNPLT